MAPFKFKKALTAALNGLVDEAAGFALPSLRNHDASFANGSLFALDALLELESDFDSALLWFRETLGVINLTGSFSPRASVALPLSPSTGGSVASKGPFSICASWVADTVELCWITFCACA